MEPVPHVFHYTEPRFYVCAFAANHFLGEQNKKFLLLLVGQFFDLLHDFCGTHGINFTAILRGIKPSNSRQLRRQFASWLRMRALVVLVGDGFGMKMFQFLAFAHERALLKITMSVPMTCRIAAVIGPM